MGLVDLAGSAAASKLYDIHYAAGQAELMKLKVQSAGNPVPRLHGLYRYSEAWRSRARGAVENIEMGVLSKTNYWHGIADTRAGHWRDVFHVRVNTQQTNNPKSRTSQGVSRLASRVTDGLSSAKAEAPGSEISLTSSAGWAGRWGGEEP